MSTHTPSAAPADTRPERPHAPAIQPPDHAGLAAPAREPGSSPGDALPAPGLIKPAIGAYRRHLLVCTGTRCTQGEAQDLFDGLGERFKAAGLDKGALRVKRTRVHCFAACKGGPVMCVQPDGTWYSQVTPSAMQRIIDEHLVGGRVVEDLRFHQGPGLLEDGDETGGHAPACAEARP